MESEWRHELEALQRLLARQQLQINSLHKQLGTPADAEEVDLPAVEYRRVFLATAAFLLWDSAAMSIAAFTSGMEGVLGQVETLLWPMCWTILMALVLGTMDSSVAGRHALLLYRGWAIIQVVVIPLLWWNSGRREVAVFLFVMFIVNAIFWPWFGRVMLKILRARGALTAQAQLYFNRAMKVLGFQILLAITGLAQGLGRESYARVYATFVFSVVLSSSWVWLTAIFDVCNVDSRAVAKLRLSPLQATTLAFWGVNLLAGLAGYILANQRRPSRWASFAVGYVMMGSGWIVMAFVGRLVYVAHRGHDVPPAASVKPVDALGSLDLPGA